MTKSNIVDVDTLNPVVQWPEHTEKLADRGIDPTRVEEMKKSLIDLGKMTLDFHQKNPGVFFGSETLNVISTAVRRSAEQVYKDAGDTGDSDVRINPSYPKTKPLAQARVDEAMQAAGIALQQALPPEHPMSVVNNPQIAAAPGKANQASVS